MCSLIESEGVSGLLLWGWICACELHSLRVCGSPRSDPDGNGFRLMGEAALALALGTSRRPPTSDKQSSKVGRQDLRHSRARMRRRVQPLFNFDTCIIIPLPSSDTSQPARLQAQALRRLESRGGLQIEVRSKAIGSDIWFMWNRTLYSINIINFIKLQKLRQHKSLSILRYWFCLWNWPCSVIRMRVSALLVSKECGCGTST
jgi:hypothetical protein